jgi:hypothetical protein
VRSELHRDAWFGLLLGDFAELQDEGAKSFVKSWNELMSVIVSAGVMLEKAAS